MKVRHPTRSAKRTAVALAVALAACLSAALTWGCASPEKPDALAPQAEQAVSAEPAGPLLMQPWPLEPAPPELPLPLPVQVAREALRRAVGQPPRVQGMLAAPLRRRWDYIVIHHSDTAEGNEATFDRYHREHNHWQGIGYDFVICNGRGGPDGLVEVTFRWEKQMDGAHAGSAEYNKRGIGICLVGNFETGRPTAKQIESLVGLVNYLQKRCQIPTGSILLHRHVRPAGTRCPGKNFPFYEFLSMLDH